MFPPVLNTAPCGVDESKLVSLEEYGDWFSNKRLLCRMPGYDSLIGNSNTECPEVSETFRNDPVTSY